MIAWTFVDKGIVDKFFTSKPIEKTGSPCLDEYLQCCANAQLCNEILPLPGKRVKCLLHVRDDKYFSVGIHTIYRNMAVLINNFMGGNYNTKYIVEVFLNADDVVSASLTGVKENLPLCELRRLATEDPKKTFTCEVEQIKGYQITNVYKISGIDIDDHGVFAVTRPYLVGGSLPATINCDLFVTPGGNPCEVLPEGLYIENTSYIDKKIKMFGMSPCYADMFVGEIMSICNGAFQAAVNNSVMRQLNSKFVTEFTDSENLVLTPEVFNKQ